MAAMTSLQLQTTHSPRKAVSPIHKQMPNQGRYS